MRATSKRDVWPVVRASGLMPVAALATHQLRYWLAYGPDANRELIEQGHSYLHAVTPWLVLALSLTVGSAFGALLSRRAPGRAPMRFWRLALLLAGALLAIYCAQELLEGIFADGHPPGLVGIFGDGGLWSIPSALLVATILATIVRGARAIHAVVDRWRQAPTRRRRRPVAVSAPAWVAAVAPDPLAVCLAGRGPPARR